MTKFIALVGANVAASGVEEDDAPGAADDDDDEKSAPSALPSGDISIRLLYQR